MEKKLNFITYSLVLLLFGIYLTKETTDYLHLKKIERIQSKRDDLQKQLIKLKQHIQITDDVLKKEIETSKSLLTVLKNREDFTNEKINAYIKDLDSIEIVIEKIKNEK